MEQCVALVDYDALAPDEISFRRGDVINVTAKGSASGFWEGYVATRNQPHNPSSKAKSGATSRFPEGEAAAGSESGKIGVFANCFVSSNLRNMTSSFFLNKAVCLYDYGGGPEDGNPRGARDAAEMHFVRGDVLTVVRPSASPGWWFGVNESARQRMRAQLMSDRSLTEGDPILAVERTRDEGSTSSAAQRLPLSRGPPPQQAERRLPTDNAPDANAVAGETGLTERQLLGIDRVCGSEDHPLLFPSNFVSCDVVQAVFSFHGRQPHELSCGVGDVILVHRRWNDGWWEGSLRGRRGIFPSNYTAPNICTTHPAFFCAKCKAVYDDTKTANMALFLHQTTTGNDRKSGGDSSVATTATHPGDNRGNDIAAGGGSTKLWRECATCAQHAHVTDSMLHALAAYDAGELRTLDLFAFVNTGASGREASDCDSARVSPSGGGRQGRDTGDPALLNAKDVADLSAGLVKF